MLRIFILEDSEERIKIFKRNLIGHEVTIATSFDEAIEKWTGKYDVTFLDADLGGNQGMDSGVDGCAEYNSGHHFAVVKQEELKKTNVFVHSLNPSEAEKIAARTKGLKVPFITINWDSLRNIFNNDEVSYKRHHA